MQQRKLKGLRAIVTGASSGIGCALAMRLAQCGVRLVVTARREERLKTLCEQVRGEGGTIIEVVGDITHPDLQQALIAKSIDEFGGLDVLINNAGIGAVGPFASSNSDTMRRVFDVNFFAPVELTRVALPVLARGKTPLLVNVGSVLGHRAVPSKSEYCSSKFALHGFSDSLRAELWRSGIHVMLVSPSTTESEFFESRISCVPEEADAHDPRARKARRSATRPFGGMSPERVARKIVRGMRRNRDELILSAGGTSLVWLDRLCPPLANWLVRRFP